MRFCARAREKIDRPTAERPVPNAIFIKKKFYLPSPTARTVCRVLLVAVARARSLLPGKLHVVSAAAAAAVTGYEVSAQCCTGSTVPGPTKTRSRPAAHHCRRRRRANRQVSVIHCTRHTHVRQGRIDEMRSAREHQSSDIIHNNYNNTVQCMYITGSGVARA